MAELLCHRSFFSCKDNTAECVNQQQRRLGDAQKAYVRSDFSLNSGLSPSCDPLTFVPLRDHELKSQRGIDWHLSCKDKNAKTYQMEIPLVITKRYEGQRVTSR